MPIIYSHTSAEVAPRPHQLHLVARAADVGARRVPVSRGRLRDIQLECLRALVLCEPQLLRRLIVLQVDSVASREAECLLDRVEFGFGV